MEGLKPKRRSRLNKRALFSDLGYKPHPGQLEIHLAPQSRRIVACAKSLLPLIRGERESNYDSIYGAYRDAQRMITKDGYKLILYPRAKKMRLYHVAEDPLEMNDLADRPDMKPIAKRLFAALRMKQKELGDTLDLAAVFRALLP